MKKNNTPSDQNKRNLLSLSGKTSVVALTAAWTAPLIVSSVVPAHAQATPGVATLCAGSESTASVTEERILGESQELSISQFDSPNGNITGAILTYTVDFNLRYRIRPMTETPGTLTNTVFGTNTLDFSAISLVDASIESNSVSQVLAGGAGQPTIIDVAELMIATETFEIDLLAAGIEPSALLGSGTVDFTSLSDFSDDRQDPDNTSADTGYAFSRVTVTATINYTCA